ncbi:universal stress protein PHOS32 [Cucumis melo var. makuwa]|uniref:Universal stress protein PHOS32 n=1 Tax=Cucumis melo var. makuwa TaxID=1194695 RepID=A0A5A7TTU6_CUCMM|nr:universal stress protein PHOS32 [Cucumis melo var. makuwa]
MDTLEEEEEYNWREVRLPSLIPVVPEPELERETAERRRGRDILIAVDHGPNSKHAFDWALIHFCRLADTIHLVHAVSNVKNELVYEFSQGLMEKLAVEAFEVAMVRTVARIVQGDAGKVICKEAEKLKPAAVVMGTRGRSLIQSVSEHVFHNCKSAPVVIVPGKGCCRRRPPRLRRPISASPAVRSPQTENPSRAVDWAAERNAPSIAPQVARPSPLRLRVSSPSGSRRRAAAFRLCPPLNPKTRPVHPQVRYHPKSTRPAPLPHDPSCPFASSHTRVAPALTFAAWGSVLLLLELVEEREKDRLAILPADLLHGRGRGRNKGKLASDQK